MKTCPKCKKSLEENDRFCDKCGFDTEEIYNDNQKKNSTKKIVFITISILAIIISIVFIIAKDPILFKYHLNKGDNEAVNTKAIQHYKKALEIKYNDEIVDKIALKVSECSDFEDELSKLKGNVNSKDLDKMYIENYISKAEEFYHNSDLQGALNYVKKAQTHGFKEKDFEFYQELVAELERESENNEKDKNEDTEDKQDINIIINDNDEKEVILNDNYPYYNNSYFIIPDSHTRYLTTSELMGYSKNELALIRNEIFARRGYIFNKKVYQDYFNSMPWYVPNQAFKGSVNELNSIEKHNVELIKSME